MDCVIFLSGRLPKPRLSSDLNIDTLVLSRFSDGHCFFSYYLLLLDPCHTLDSTNELNRFWRSRPCNMWSKSKPSLLWRIDNRHQAKFENNIIITDQIWQKFPTVRSWRMCNFCIQMFRGTIKFTGFCIFIHSCVFWSRHWYCGFIGLQIINSQISSSIPIIGSVVV